MLRIIACGNELKVSNPQQPKINKIYKISFAVGEQENKKRDLPRHVIDLTPKIRKSFHPNLFFSEKKRIFVPWSNYAKKCCFCA